MLTSEQEEKHMKEIKKLISGEVKSIGPQQADSLISLSKEFIRRGQEIDSLYKEMDDLDIKIKELTKECE